MKEEQVSETEQLQQQVADANDNVLRIQAEMQNMRRRAERDVRMHTNLRWINSLRICFRLSTTSSAHSVL